jgi:Holliday junction resolvasome RuvABC endonuclease subunit
MKENTVLAIELGSRELGYAVIKQGQLFRAGIKSLRRPNSHPGRIAVLKRVFTSLIEQNMPTAVAMVNQEVCQGRRSRFQKQLSGTVQLIANDHNVSVRKYLPTTVKRTVTGESKATNRLIAGSLCGIYPHLSHHIEYKQKWKQRYVQHMFDAVACGLTHLAHGDTNQNQNDEIQN